MHWAFLSFIIELWWCITKVILWTIWTRRYNKFLSIIIKKICYAMHFLLMIGVYHQTDDENMIVNPLSLSTKPSSNRLEDSEVTTKSCRRLLDGVSLFISFSQTIVIVYDGLLWRRVHVALRHYSFTTILIQKYSSSKTFFLQKENIHRKIFLSFIL